MAKKVLYLSEQMLDMAYQSQWQKFSQLEKNRQELLETLFKFKNIQSFLPKISILLQQVLNYDNESIVLSEVARNTILFELSKIRSNSIALDNYKKLSSLGNLK